MFFEYSIKLNINFSSKKLIMELPFDPVISLLGIYLKNLRRKWWQNRQTCWTPHPRANLEIQPNWRTFTWNFQLRRRLTSRKNRRLAGRARWEVGSRERRNLSYRENYSRAQAGLPTPARCDASRPTIAPPAGSGSSKQLQKTAGLLAAEARPADQSQ